MAFKKNIIAIIYDFDGTLSPQPMQEYTVFPQLNIKSEDFWLEIKKENIKIGGEEIITYMMLMLKRANQDNIKIRRADFGRMAKQIKFFPGVGKTYFERINNFVAKESSNHIKVRHYIISSGLKEILNKIKNKNYFKNIFASEYCYNQYGQPIYPKLVVTDTVKTQFLFRINKGKEKLSESINEFMAEEDRPIPFSNIIYIGDGMTDVPCMTVTTKNGGYSVAVYNPKEKKSLKRCKELFRNARVAYIAEANYRKDSELEKFLKATLKLIIQDVIIFNIQKDMMIRRKIR